MELHQAALFRGLPDDFMKSLCRMARLSTYSRDETLFYEGDPATDLYVLKEGRIELTFTLPQDPTTEIRITQISPGENFAWSSLAQGETLSSHARAIEDSTAFVIPATALHAELRDHAQTGYEVMKRLSQQILSRLRDTRRELRWLHHGAR